MTTNKIISFRKEEEKGVGGVVEYESRGQEIKNGETVFSPRDGDKEVGMKWKIGEVFYILFCGERQNRYFIRKQLLDAWVMGQKQSGE